MAQDMQLDAKTAEVTETESALEKNGDETKEPSAEESPQEPVASPSEEPTEEVQEPQLPEEMPPSEEEETPDTAPAAESETDGSSQENFILEQETAATGEAALKKDGSRKKGKSDITTKMVPIPEIIFKRSAAEVIILTKTAIW